MPTEGAVLCKLLRQEINIALKKMIISPRGYNKDEFVQKTNDDNNEMGEDEDRTGLKFKDIETVLKTDSTQLALGAVRRLVQLDSYQPPQFL